jgi:hypothetical protein
LVCWKATTNAGDQSKTSSSGGFSLKERKVDNTTRRPVAENYFEIKRSEDRTKLEKHAELFKLIRMIAAETKPQPHTHAK